MRRTFLLSNDATAKRARTTLLILGFLCFEQQLFRDCEDNISLVCFILTINSHPDRSCGVANSVGCCTPVLSILFSADVF